MSKVIIRKAKDNELKVIQDLNYQLFLHDEEYDSSLNMDWPYQQVGEEYFKNKICGKDGVCFVAEVDGAVVGYLAGGMIEPYSYRNIKKESELENTLVKEEFRGHGIGEKLFQEFIEGSKEQSAEKIKVSASAGNSRAIKFYQNVGFVPYATELEYDIKD